MTGSSGIHLVQRLHFVRTLVVARDAPLYLALQRPVGMIVAHLIDRCSENAGCLINVSQTERVVSALQGVKALVDLHYAEAVTVVSEAIFQDGATTTLTARNSSEKRGRNVELLARGNEFILERQNVLAVSVGHGP